MATEPIRIPIRQVSKEITVVGPDAEILIDDGTSMGRAKASNAIDARAAAVADGKIAALSLNTASQQPVEAFATAAQGAKADSAVQPAREITAGAGLTGGGDLSADRTLALSSASIGSLNKADTAMQPSIYDPDGKEADAFDSANQAYDNAASGLASSTAQGAIDELADRDVVRVEDRTALKALDGVRTPAAIVYGEGGRNGTFTWLSGNRASLVTSDPGEGVYVAPSSDPTGASGAWVRQFSGSVDARWFGAAGDGTTDCAPAIQAAIDLFESLSQGATIALPRGSVRMLSGVTSEGAGIFIRGEGREATIVRPVGSFDVFTFVSTHRGWGLLDLSVKYGTRPTGSLVLQADVALSGVVRNIYCENIANGFSIGNAQATSIENIEMWDFAGDAVHFSGSLNDVFMQNIFLNGENEATSTGWRITGKAHAMMVSNVEIVQCGVPAIWVGQAASTDTIAFSQLFNCFFDSSAAPASYQYLRDVEFHGCWWSQRETGAVFDDSKIVKFFGGGAVNCDNHGFILEDGCVDFEFHGFTADSNSQSASNSYSGVVVASGASHVRFFGGYYGNGGGFSATQSNGILFGGSNDNYLVQGARFDGNLALPIAGHTPSSTKRVRDCIGVITENDGTAEVSLTSGEGTIAHGLSYTPRAVTLLVVNGGAAEATLKSVDGANITVRIRNTTTDANSTGSWFVNWSATA